MRSKNPKNRLRKFLGLLLCLSFLNKAAVHAFARTAAPEDRNLRKIKPVKAESLAQIFGEIKKFGRSPQFLKILERDLSAEETAAALDWIDARDAQFFEALYGEYERKSEAFEKQRFEPEAAKPKTGPVKTAPAPARRKPLNKRRAALDLSGGAFFQNASFRRTAFETETMRSEEPQVTTVETENGVETSGKTENRFETAETVITKGSSGDVKKILDDARHGQTATQTSFEEIYNKKTRGRVRNEKTFYWSYTLAQCPDADGSVEGEATVRVENKMTVANTTTIAIPAQVLSMKLKLKGFVNDEAELTHYDAAGEVTETTSGYDRARRLDMIDETSIADGTRTFSVSITGNRIGTGSGQKNQPGEISEGSTAHLSDAELNRMMDFADTALPLNLVNADNGFAASRRNWQLGFCVDVALAAPKTKLRSGEQITVAAETVHKLDSSKISARLEASGFEAVTPDRQTAEPAAQFTLTASSKEYSGGEITVRSISRRGIGTKTLVFGKEKPAEKPKQTAKKPVRTKKCGGWTGKITAVKRKRSEKRNPASGRLIREIELKEETFSIEYNVLGIPSDETPDQTNAFYSEARADYRAVRFTEKNYAAGKTSCGSKIITSPETQKYEDVLTAQADERITVNITSTGEKGILLFGVPQLNARRIATTTYETTCPDYDRVNSSVDRDEALIEIAVPYFEIEFELGPESDSQLNGSQTIQNDDGSETIVTWSLVRTCK